MAKAASKKKAESKKKGASPVSASSSSAALPGWVWMLSGLAVGLFVAFLVYLQMNKPQQASTPTASKQVAEAKTDKKQHEAAKTPSVPAEKEKDGFEFYTVLPELEVLVPEEKSDKETDKPAPITKQGTYVLQSGSFRRFEDADRRKANLALLGVESTIQKVTVNDNEVWHRVRVGPYKSLRELNEVRLLLHENNIETLLVRIKG